MKSLLTPLYCSGPEGFGHWQTSIAAAAAVPAQRDVLSGSKKGALFNV